MIKRKLSTKQQLFVDEYLIDMNATEAAKRAGYSEKTAYSQGQRLLKHVEIKKVFQKHMERRAERTEITQDKVLKELAIVAFGDLRNAVSWGPRGVVLKDSQSLTQEEAGAIAEVSETTTKDGGSQRIKRYDKVKALELIGRHLGMFTDKIEHSVNIDLAKAIEDARKRASKKS